MDLFINQITDNNKARPFKKALPSLMTQSIVSQNIKTATLKTRESPHSKEPISMKMENSKTNKETSIQKPDQLLNKSDSDSDKIDKPSKKNLDLSQHENISESKQKELLERSVRKAKIITGKSSEDMGINKNDSKENVPLPKEQDEDDNMDTKRKRILDTSISSGKKCKISERQDNNNPEIITQTTMKTTDKGSTNKYSWLMKTITRIINSPSPKMRQHKCKFENDTRSAEHNGQWLKHYKWDLEKALTRQKGTMLETGSEFREVEILEPLWSRHKFWPNMKKIVTEGLTYPLEEIPDETRKEDLLHMMKRGNHKSAQIPEINAQTLMKNYTKEVKHGWMLPIPKRVLHKLKGASVIPVGVATQFTIDDKGNRVVKRRTTHDASFPPPSKNSVNNRLIKDLLVDCQYGHCLLRVLHNIHVMRLTYPHLMILLIKYDLDAAYRRLHLTALMALLTITIIKEIAYILLRLPFGVANGPNDYGTISEPIFDLTNEILQDETFNPSEIHSPLQKDMATQKEYNPKDTPFGVAAPLIVNVPFHFAKADGYIDDIITVVLNYSNWVWKALNAAPLAIYSLFRPTDKNDPLPRNDALSKTKMEGEGSPEEIKIVLGWKINTRLFKIFLPMTKATDWIQTIKSELNKNKIKATHLESLIGKLNHV